MPENSAIHHEPEQIVSFNAVLNRQKRDATPVSEEEEFLESDEILDIGELLGFRITGGRDFFMPITIFHVNITNTCCRHRLTDLSCLR